MKCANAWRARDKAIKERRARFGDPETSDGKDNAFKHCVWSCEMARSIGQECAKYIGDQHEEAGNRGKRKQRPDEAEMDYHNNHIGRELADIGKEVREIPICEMPCDEDIIMGCAYTEQIIYHTNCSDLCMNALNNGRLRFIKKSNLRMARQLAAQ